MTPTPTTDTMLGEFFFSHMSRVLLKISGEMLSGEKEQFDLGSLKFLCDEIRPAVQNGVQVGIVLGGGNLWRGRDQEAYGFFRGESDKIGMLATVINALVVSNFFALHGIPAEVLSARIMQNICEPFSRERAEKGFAEGKVILFAGGTGSPFFTTDSAAALRAVETQCDFLAKATTVEGVFTADPKKDPHAQKYETLSFHEAIQKDLKVMDASAFSLCKENAVPIRVFDGFIPGNISAILQGKNIGTLVQ